mmetsp:Transcript_5871/g.21062  ORF Transcript_5871/g.21062 Transcript_5871/m.21062 type:complete len:272 (+) Transcript_5871:84-899(+)
MKMEPNASAINVVAETVASGLRDGEVEIVLAALPRGGHHPKEAPLAHRLQPPGAARPGHLGGLHADHLPRIPVQRVLQQEEHQVPAARAVVAPRGGRGLVHDAPLEVAAVRGGRRAVRARALHGLPHVRVPELDEAVPVGLGGRLDLVGERPGRLQAAARPERVGCTPEGEAPVPDQWGRGARRCARGDPFPPPGGQEGCLHRLRVGVGEVLEPVPRRGEPRGNHPRGDGLEAPAGGPGRGGAPFRRSGRSRPVLETPVRGRPGRREAVQR